MTEAEWLSCENPHHALWMLRTVGRPSRRKERLAAVAGLRHFWADLSEDQRYAVMTAERYADGEIRYSAMQAAAVRAEPGTGGTLPWAVARITHRQGADSLQNSISLFLPVVINGPIYTNPPFPDAKAFAEHSRPMMTILRCLFGNPFRPATLEPAWQTATVHGLAQAIYEERGFDRLPILADALEEAGCTNADILTHCRGSGSHARGCWVVDLLLGKE